MPRFFAADAATLFFPMALILYDFAAYLSTDLIQPGIINVVRDFNADVSLAPAAVSLDPPAARRCSGCWLAFRQDWPQASADYRGANIYPCLRCDNVHNVYDTVSYRACNSGHQYCFFIATVGYVTVQEAFGQTKGIKLMAIITSIVLIAPIIGPLSGAALMHFVHWKVLFAIIAVMGSISFVG